MVQALFHLWGDYITQIYFKIFFKNPNYKNSRGITKKSNL